MNATRTNALSQQRGFTALEVLVVLIVSIAALALSGQWIRGYSDNLVNQAAAEHAKTVAEAATRYIKDNYAAVLALATPKAPVITVEMLQKTNYLPPSFTATNPYGQAYSIWALQAVAGKLQTLIVTTGGDVIGELNLRRVAQLIGAQGGHLAGANATGSYGGWTIPLADYGLAANPGHLAVALFLQDGAVVSDYLYRNAVPGHAELNTMNTPLIMAATVNVGTPCAPTGAIARDGAGAVLSCQGVTWKSQAGNWKDAVANYASLPWSGNTLGDVRLTTDNQRAYAWTGGGWAALAVDQNGNMTIPGAVYAAGGRVVAWNQVTEGGVLQLQGANGVNMYLESINGTFRLVNHPWNAQLFSVDQSGNVSAAGRMVAGEYVQINGVAAEGAGCSPNGLVGQNGNGLLLSCQSGSWKKVGGVTAALRQFLCFWNPEWGGGLTYTGQFMTNVCNSTSHSFAPAAGIDSWAATSGNSDRNGILSGTCYCYQLY